MIHLQRRERGDEMEEGLSFPHGAVTGLSAAQSCCHNNSPNKPKRLITELRFSTFKNRFCSKAVSFFDC